MERTALEVIAMVHMPGVGWERDTETQTEQEAYWEAGAAMWTKVGASDEPADLEHH